MRIDKWLWAARFFKTRSLASHACDLGRIESNGQQVKPSREVRAGDLLKVKNESGEFLVEVLGLSEMRGPAATARTLYSRRRPAGSCGSSWRKSAKRCRILKRRGKVNLRNATGVSSTACAGSSRAGHRFLWPAISQTTQSDRPRYLEMPG